MATPVLLAWSGVVEARFQKRPFDTACGAAPAEPGVEPLCISKLVAKIKTSQNSTGPIFDRECTGEIGRLGSREQHEPFIGSQVGVFEPPGGLRTH